VSTQTAAAVPVVDAHEPRYRWLAATVVALGSTASILAMTTVNVAIPALQKVFGASLADIQWVLTGYMLGLAAVIPISGYLSDRFGTKRVYVYSLVAFSLTSLLCGLAWSLQTEIAFRVIQGVAGGMVMPVGMAMLMRATPARERGRMMGILGVPMLLGPAMGPAVGGLLIRAFDWQWIFWINLPIGMIAIVLAILWLRDTDRLPVGRIDVVGALLAVPGVAVIIYGVTRAPVHGWASWETLAPTLIGAGLVVAFVVWSLARTDPLLDMRVFKDAAFTGSQTVNLVLAVGLFGAVFLIPVFLQQVQGYDTLGAGLLIGAQGVGAAIVMPVAGYLTDRVGARPVVFTGVSILIAVSVLLTGVSPDTPPAVWVGLLGLRGVAIGCAMMPSFSSAFATLPPAAIARATAVANSLQRIVSSFGIAILASVAQTRISAHLPQHLAGPGAHAAGLLAVSRGFDDTLWLAAGVTMIALPATMLLRRPRQSPDEYPEPLSRRLKLTGLALVLLAALGLAFSLSRAFGPV
jgi:EmrB/QacA subfamily drug resistance transporter